MKKLTICIVDFVLKKGHGRAFIDALKSLRQKVFDNEPGCVRFEIYYNQRLAEQVKLLIAFEDQASYKAHFNQDYLIDFVENVSRKMIFSDEHYLYVNH